VYFSGWALINKGGMKNNMISNPILI